MAKPVLFLDNNFLIHIYGQEPQTMAKGAHFDPKLGAQVLDELSQKYDLRVTSTVLREATEMDQFVSIKNWFKANETGVDGQPPRVKVYQTPAFDGLKNGGEDSIAAVINAPPATRDPTLPPASDTVNLKIATANRTDFNKSGLAGNTVRTQTVMEEALADGTVSRPTFNAYAAGSGEQLTARGGFLSADEVLAGKRTFNPDGTPTGQAPWVRAAAHAPAPPAPPPPPGPPEAELEAAIKKVCTPEVANTIHNIKDAEVRRAMELQTLRAENLRFKVKHDNPAPHPDIPNDLPRPGSLAGKNLAHIDLHGLNLENLDLKGANLTRANLKDAIIGATDLQDANLRGADMRGVAMTGGSLEGAKLNGADFRPSVAADGVTYNANLQGVYMAGADFTGAKMQGALIDIYGTAQGAKFNAADLTGARIEGNYDGVDMKGAILTNARIEKDTLSTQQLAEAVDAPPGVVATDAPPAPKAEASPAAPPKQDAAPVNTPAPEPSPPPSKFVPMPDAATPPAIPAPVRAPMTGTRAAGMSLGTLNVLMGGVGIYQGIVNKDAAGTTLGALNLASGGIQVTEQIAPGVLREGVVGLAEKSAIPLVVAGGAYEIYKAPTGEKGRATGKFVTSTAAAGAVMAIGMTGAAGVLLPVVAAVAVGWAFDKQCKLSELEHQHDDRMAAIKPDTAKDAHLRQLADMLDASVKASKEKLARDGKPVPAEDFVRAKDGSIDLSSAANQKTLQEFMDSQRQQLQQAANNTDQLSVLPNFARSEVKQRTHMALEESMKTLDAAGAELSNIRTAAAPVSDSEKNEKQVRQDIAEVEARLKSNPAAAGVDVLQYKYTVHREGPLGKSDSLVPADARNPPLPDAVRREWLAHQDSGEPVKELIYKRGPGGRLVPDKLVYWQIDDPQHPAAPPPDSRFAGVTAGIQAPAPTAAAAAPPTATAEPPVAPPPATRPRTATAP